MDKKISPDKQRQNLLWELFNISNETAFKSTLKRVTRGLKNLKDVPAKKTEIALRPVTIVRKNFVYYDPLVFESEAELRMFVKEMMYYDSGKKTIVIDIINPEDGDPQEDFMVSKTMFGKFIRRFKLERNYGENRKAYYTPKPVKEDKKS